MRQIELTPIGVIHSPYKTRAQAPFQGIYSNEEFEIEIFKEYSEGLKDIDGYSHLILLYFAHKSESFHLQTSTPWDTTNHGVFTTCSPFRPNHLLLSVVPLLKRKGDRILIVTHLDAIDGTPLLDIKPYVPSLMIKKGAHFGWMEKKRVFQNFKKEKGRK
ncbi:MAG: tRNA (N6-threonylcarbamoyladenosine(37)-N6)-methyltransferase TrmO [Candidatus Helarchaeota archaeon]